MVLAGYKADKDALVNHAEDFGDRDTTPIFHNLKPSFGRANHSINPGLNSGRLEVPSASSAFPVKKLGLQRPTDSNSMQHREELMLPKLFDM